MMPLVLELLLQRRRLLISLLVLLLLDLALFGAISWYQAPRLQTVHARWNELRRMVAGQGKADAATLYRQAAADLETLHKRIASRRDFPRVLGEIVDAAAVSGVTTGGISYRPGVVKGEGLLQYQISMNVAGSYAATKSFLADLQASRELLVVDSMTLANSDPYEENVAMDLRLSLYLREAP